MGIQNTTEQQPHLAVQIATTTPLLNGDSSNSCLNRIKVCYSRHIASKLEFCCTPMNDPLCSKKTLNRIKCFMGGLGLAMAVTAILMLKYLDGLDDIAINLLFLGAAFFVAAVIMCCLDKCLDSNQGISYTRH